MVTHLFVRETPILQFQFIRTIWQNLGQKGNPIHSVPPLINPPPGYLVESPNIHMMHIMHSHANCNASTVPTQICIYGFVEYFPCSSPFISLRCNISLVISFSASRYSKGKSDSMPIPIPDLRSRCHGCKSHFDTVHQNNVQAQKCPSNRTMVCCRGSGMVLLKTRYRQHLQQTSFV